MKLPNAIWVLVDENLNPFAVYARREEAKDALAEFEETWKEGAKIVKYTRGGHE